MPITNRNSQIMEWESVAADPVSHPLEAIEACNLRLATHGPTLRCKLMCNKVIRRLIKLNDFPLAKKYGLKPVDIRNAAKALKSTLQAAVDLQKAQQEQLDAPPRLLKVGVITKFANGSSWTLRDGNPEKVEEAAHVE